jgi:hypothetical protein
MPGCAKKRSASRGHRGKKGHRQPEEELRVLSLDADPQGMAVDLLDPGQGKGIEVDPGIGRNVLRRLPQRLSEFTEPDDPVGHHAEDRRMDARQGEALDLVDVVVGGQFAAAGLRKIAKLLPPVGDIFPR